MKGLKTILGAVLATTCMGGAIAFAVGSTNSFENRIQPASAAVSKTVTRVYIEDQVTTTPVLAIESISFATGYNHDLWRAFLTSYLGARSSYTTTSGSSMPSSKGWSYMSNSEQEKYLLCPSGGKNFTMIFPEWVTAFSYKAVGNNWWNWFDVNGSAVGLHSGWGIGKKVNSYIYNDGGWKMNANLDNTAQTNTWGDVTISANAAYNGEVIDQKNITMSKYYLMSSQTYGSVFGYNVSGWYTTAACTSSHSSLITTNSTVFAKATLNKEAHLAGTMNDWNATDDNYLLSPNVDNQYYISVSFAANTEFKVVYDQGADGQDVVWYGWSQIDTTSKVVTNGFIIEGTDDYGTRIKVITPGQYEIFYKTTGSGKKIWMQQESGAEAESWASGFVSGVGCATSLSTGNAPTGWATYAATYANLTDGAKNVLYGTTGSNANNATNVEKAAFIYDMCVRKYTSCANNRFMVNSSGVARSSSRITMVSNNTNDSMVFVIVAVSVAAIVVGTYFFLHKKKHQ